MTHVGVDLTVYPKIGLVIFVTVFALSLVWIFRKGSTKTYDATSNLPFEDEAGKK
ncbi:MAG: cbb3-type cytochrome c oxidase subunit 3 [Fibrobacterota bacterium]